MPQKVQSPRIVFKPTLVLKDEKDIAKEGGEDALE